MYNDLKRSVYFLKITDNPSRNPFLWLAATACSGSKSSSCEVAAAVAASIEWEHEERLGYCTGIYKVVARMGVGARVAAG
jgi:hypothetical protein